MVNERLARLFRRWTTGVRPTGSSRKLRAPLQLERVEERVTPTVLPAPTVSGQQTLFNPTDTVQAWFPTPLSPGANPVDTTNVQAASDPLNSLRQVFVAQQLNDAADPNDSASILAKFSVDGGISWTTFTSPGGTKYVDSTSDPNNPQNYRFNFSPSVAMDRNNQIYVTWLQQNRAGGAGVIGVNRYLWTPGTAPVLEDLDPADRFGVGNKANLINFWKGQQAFNPTIIVNNNPATYTDPDSNKTNTDPSTGAIYIAYNTVNPAPNPAPNPYNPNRIEVVSSTDRGQSFGGHQYVDDAGFANFPDAGGTAPALAVAPITSDAPGALFVAYQRTATVNNKAGTMVDVSLSQPSITEGSKVFTPATGTIFDAIDPGNGGAHLATTTDFTISIAGLPANFSLTDLDVTLAINHGAINQVKVQLVSPSGTAFTLLNNRTNTAGTDSTATPPAGLASIAAPDSLGIWAGRRIGTTFDDSASRVINDPASTAPFLGNYRPEGGSLANTFQGLTKAQAEGNWLIRITDNRADNPAITQQLTYASIRLTSRFGGTSSAANGFSGFGADATLKIGGLPLTGNPGLAQPFIPSSGLSPTVGIGSGVSMATNAALAAIGANGLPLSQITGAGNVYAAITYGVDANSNGTLDPNEDTNVSLAAISTRDLRNDVTGARNPLAAAISLANKQVNQDSAADSQTEGNRYQFGPTVAVDPKTGAVAVSWYDARNDASNARVARYFGVSINGGATFSPEGFFNLPKTATDAITSGKVTIEPVPDNLATAGAQGFGGRQALLFDNGRLNAFWSGNQNNTRGGVYTAQAQTAVGPRIIYADMGPVTTLSQRQYTTPIAPQQPAFFVYNNTTAADGTRQIDGFRVVFDRQIDPTSFTPDDIRVYYSSPDPTAKDGNGKLLTARELRELFGIGYQIFDLSDSTNPLLPIPAGQTGNTITPNREFFVRFIDPATANNPIPTARPVSMVGTYAYTVGPFVRDRIRQELPASGTTIAPVQTPPGSTFDTPFVNSTATPLNSRPYDPPPGFSNPQPPAVDPWESAPDNRGVTTSVITLPSLASDPTLPAGAVIGRLQVSVDLVDTRRGGGTAGLILQLKGPNGQVITLSRLRGGNGASYDQFVFEGTTFDDGAALPVSFGSGNYASTFRPDGLIFNGGAGSKTIVLPGETALDGVGLSAFNGIDTAGTWTLRVIDNYNADNQFETSLGYLRSWSIRVVPGVSQTGYGPATTDPANPNNSVFRGNVLDQDADANAWEPGDDLFAAPRPQRRTPVDVAGAPLPGAFDKSTLPLTVPGPRIVGVSVSATGTFSNSVEPVYVNTGGSQLFVRFDRDMQTAVVGGATVLMGATVTLVGPTGPVSLPAARVVQTTPGDLRTFTVDFGSTLLIGGQYSLQFGPNIRSAVGDYIDPDSNAGIDTLFGGNVTTSVVDTKVYQNSTPVPLSSAPVIGTTNGFVASGEAVAEIPISVADAFQIAQDLTRYPDARLKLELSVTDANPNDPTSLFSSAANLQAVLVAPDGTRVKLFTALASPGTVTTNIVFDDNALLPIQGGVDPFRTQAYKPQFPLAALLGKWSTGTWKVVVSHQLFRLNAATNPVTAAQIGTINFARLTLTRAVGSPNPGGGANTGAGQVRADEQTVPFRVFNQDPSSPEASQLWTPLGGAPTNGQANAGRVTSVVVDPADPSGNTVFAAGASGGVWKTTNFLTSDPRGPSWIPLTDFGPNNSLNIASIAVVPRSADPLNKPSDYDPNLTLVFALTGEGNYLGQGPGNNTSTVPGVGVLRSVDGGRTWEVLDSTTNVGLNGAILPINSPARDRRFVGASGFKIVADPVPLEVSLGVEGTALNNTALYMAVSGGNGAGIWRSKDTGRTWELLRAGDATDVVLSPGSAGPEGNLQVLYGAMAGDGVYFTSQATTILAGTLNERRGGGLLNNLIRDQQRNDAAVAVNNSASFPGAGSFDRLTLATPGFTNSPLLNQSYQSWLYALATNADGTFNGLYVTKDFGRNWTRVILTQVLDGQGNVWGSNNETGTGYDPNPTNKYNIAPAGQTETSKYVRVNGQGGVGSLTSSLAIDPLNPNVIYIGGQRTIRVDISKLKDAQAFYALDMSQGGVGAANNNATFGTGAITIDDTKLPANSGGQVNPSVLQQLQGSQPGPTNPSYGYFVGFTNLSRDPDNPFLTPSTIPVNNALAFTNTGENATWQHFVGITGSSRDVYEITPIVDPLTGRTRLIFGTANGVYTGVDRGDGTLVTAIAQAPAGSGVTLTQSSQVVTGTRNGNLQIGQYYSGAVQPSRLAADIAGALFYAVSQDNGFVVSRPDIIETGNVNWAGEWTSGTGPGTGIDVATDQTGSGTGYQYRLPAASVSLLPTDFFRLLLPGGNQAGSGVSRTSGLVQGGDDPANGVGQWSNNDTQFGYFAVNPIDRNGVVISSSTGQVFRTQDAGQNWQPIGNPAGAYLRALAFGGVNPAAPTQFNNYILAGSVDGRMFYTTTGQNNWVQVDDGGVFNGRPILKIIPNPRPQSASTLDAYVLTDRGVFYSPNVRTGGNFQNLTGNLFSLQQPYFLGTGQQVFANKTLTGVNVDLTALAVDWRYTTPVVYVAGQGGVFRLVNSARGLNWTVYPDNPAGGTYLDGGYLPNVRVTDLDLSLGTIDPTTGMPFTTTDPVTNLPRNGGGLNMLLATTYGRGSWGIRINPQEGVYSDPADPFYNVVRADAFVSGPKVRTLATADAATGQSLNPTTPVVGGTTSVRVVFDTGVDPVTFNNLDVTLKAPDGTIIPQNLVSVRLVSTVPQGQPEPRNVYDISFPTPATNATGFYFLRIGDPTSGPLVTDLAGNRMNQNANGINGEPASSANGDDNFTSFVYLYGQDNSLFVSGLPSKLSTWAPAAFTVTAIDKYGNTNVGFGGQVTFASSDPNAVLPAAYTFTGAGGDNGRKAFTVSFRNGSSIADPVGLFQSLTVSTADVTYNPGQTGTNVLNARYDVSGFTAAPGKISAWAPQDLTARLLDYNGRLLTTYAGLTTLSSSDPDIAYLTPNPAQYTAQDNGSRVHTPIFHTHGVQTLTFASDFGVDPLTLTADIQNAKFVLSGLSNPVSTWDPKDVTVQVVAFDGSPLPYYGGTVSFTTSDPNGYVPAPYTFAAGPGSDNGSKLYPTGVMFLNKGNQSITLKSAAGTDPLGGVDPLTVPTVVHNAKFQVVGLAASPVAGQATGFALRVVDENGKVLPAFAGAVTFATNDGRATLPAPNPYTFKPGIVPNGTPPASPDNGSKSFAVTYRTAGTKDLSANTPLGVDPIDPGALTVKVVAAAASRLTLAGFPSTVVAGTPETLTVTAFDPFDNVATGYAGTVTISTGDRKAVGLPLSYTFNPTSATPGTAQFPGVQLRTAGTQTILASDPVNGLAAAQSGILVTAKAAVAFEVRGYPNPVAAGTVGDLVVRAIDDYGNTDPTYAKAVVFSSSDGRVSMGNGLPAQYQFVAGQGQVSLAGSVQLKTAGLQSITATESGGAITGSQTNILVTPNAASKFAVGGFPSPIQSGTSGGFQVTVTDVYGNLVSDYLGTVKFAGSDGLATLPANYAFQLLDKGVHTFAATMRTAGTQSITVTDTQQPGVTGSQTGIVVTQSPASSLAVGGFPASVVVGQPGGFTVTVLDALGNVATGFTGTVTFSSSDPAAVFPATSYTFTAADAGTKAFTGVVLNTPGAQTITVTPSIPGVSAGVMTTTVAAPPPTVPPLVPSKLLAVGVDLALLNRVRVYNQSGTVVTELRPFEPGYSVGTRVAMARQPGGVEFVAAVPGQGRPSDLRVFDPRTGQQVALYETFEASFTGGSFISAGDINDDGTDDFVVSADVGGGPRVRVISGANGSVLADFLGIEDPNFRGGARTAVADMNGDGVDDLIVAAGFGGGPRVAIFDGRTVAPGQTPQRLIGDFFAFEQSLRNGVYVAAGDINGDGKAELVAGAGPGGGPRVLTLDGASLMANRQVPVSDFFAGDTSNRNGIRVAVKDRDNDGFLDIVTGAGDGDGTRVTVYAGKSLRTGTGTPSVIESFDELPDQSNGVYVGQS
ncbi:MAG: proprotein convertase P-domain-containing protein [Gemmataceae bacterium]